MKTLDAPPTSESQYLLGVPLHLQPSWLLDNLLRYGAGLSMSDVLAINDELTRRELHQPEPLFGVTTPNDYAVARNEPEGGPQ